MAIKFPQHDLPPDLFNGRLSGASSVWGEDAGTLLLEDFFEPTPVGGGVTGSMAVTETGADAFAGAGVVIVKGALAVTESGTDTFASSGDVFVQGALSVTETGSDTFASSGDVIVQGSCAVTETGIDTASMTGVVVVSGTMAVQEVGDDVFSASSAPAAQPKRGGYSSRTAPRRIIHVEYTRKLGPDDELERIIEGRDEEQPTPEQRPVPAPTPAPFTAAPKTTFIDIAPIIEGAATAYADEVKRYAGEVAQQAAVAQQQRIQREQVEQARMLLEAEIAKARDEDEAASLVMIMAVA